MPYSFLFPAYAGVILVGVPTNAVLLSFPRLRGGDPMGSHTPSSSLFFSLPARG